VKTILFCMASLAIVTPALAQNNANFQGAKVGAVLGYDTTNFEYQYDDDDDTSYSVHESKAGLLYGVTAGYDFALGSNAIIGIEAEASDSTAKFSARDLLYDGDKLSLMADRDLYIGARIGVAVTPTMLLYAKGGYTNARMKLRYSYEGDSASVGDNLDGYRVGGGAEFTSGTHFARVEYRYSDYGKYTYREDGVILDTDTKVSHHQVAVTGGLRF
jgi:outer membrane immunogenic protein